MISLLLPTRGRPEQLKQVIKAIADTVANPDNIEVIIRIDNDDPEDYSFLAPPGNSPLTTTTSTPVPSFCRIIAGPALNKMEKYNEAYRLSRGDILMPLCDEAYLISPGWDEIIEKEFAECPDKILLLHGPNGSSNEALATNFIISRRWADALGYFVPPIFKAFFADNFIQDIGQRIGRKKYNPNIVIDHRAVHVGKAKVDNTFRRAINYFAEDKKKYESFGAELLRAIQILNGLKDPSNEIRLAIGIPLSFPFIPSSFFYSFALMEKPDFIFIHDDNGPIDGLRNNIVDQAIKEGATHLIMLDTDMIYHPQTITRLLSHRLPVVAAMSFRRYPPFDPILLRRGENGGAYEHVEEWKENELVEVDATGAGCIMFNMEVFRKIPRPWFKFITNADTGATIGEDVGFCQELKEAGYRIFVDTSVPSDHLTVMAVNEKTHRLYRAMKNEQQKREMAKALGISKTE